MIAKLSKQDVERLLTDPSPGNRAETAAKLACDFQEGGLGPRERAVALAAIEVCEELDYDGGPGDRARYRRRVIERLLTQLDAAGRGFAGLDSGSLDYLMAKLGELRAA